MMMNFERKREKKKGKKEKKKSRAEQSRAGCRIFFSFGKMESSFFFNLIFFFFFFGFFLKITQYTQKSLLIISRERQREICPISLIHQPTNQPTLYITGLILILLLLLLEESHRLVHVDFGVDVGVDGRVPVVAAARVTVGVDAVYTVAAISIVVVVVVVAATTTTIVVVVVVISSSVVAAAAVVVVVVSVVVGDTRTAATAAAATAIVSIISSSSSIVAIATWKAFRVEAVYATGASSSATTTTLIISRVLALAVRSESFKRLVEFSLGIAVFPCAERAFFVDRMESVYDGRLGVFAAIAVDFVVDAFGVRAQVDARGRLGRSGL